MFRAQDPKNFYVTKLEIVKPGLEPTVALVRFAVINGEEQTHAQLPAADESAASIPCTRFASTRWAIISPPVCRIEKVDDWTDDRIKTGGVGLYSERGEDATLKGGMNVVPLIVRK